MEMGWQKRHLNLYVVIKFIQRGCKIKKQTRYNKTRVLIEYYLTHDAVGGRRGSERSRLDLEEALALFALVVAAQV
jgi:hypothetical protein